MAKKRTTTKKKRAAARPARGRKRTSTKKAGARKKAPSRGKKKATRGRRKTTSARGGTGKGLAGATTSELKRELGRRQQQLTGMLARRDKVARELGELDAEITALGIAIGRPTPATAGRKRPRNEKNLVDSLHSLLKGRTMGVSEAAIAVQDAGYKTTSPNFRTIVNQSLLSNKKLFHKVARGQYTAK